MFTWEGTLMNSWKIKTALLKLSHIDVNKSVNMLIINCVYTFMQFRKSVTWNVCLSIQVLNNLGKY